MKKIINGKLYSTETAHFLGSWDNGCIPGDFNYLAESLYLKRTGEYFIYGEGGPRSKYSVTCGQNGWSGGDAITPVSVDDSRQWAEDHLTADEYEEIFGTVSEDSEIDGGQRIKSLRQSRGLTQQALADASGLNLRQIQKLEGGEAAIENTTLNTCIALADALGISDLRELV